MPMYYQDNNFVEKEFFLTKSKTYFYLEMIRENPETDSIQTDDEQPGNGEKVSNGFENQHFIMNDYQNFRQFR